MYCWCSSIDLLLSETKHPKTVQSHPPPTTTHHPNTYVFVWPYLHSGACTDIGYDLHGTICMTCNRYKPSVSFTGFQMCPMLVRVALQSQDGFQKTERQRWWRRAQWGVTVIDWLCRDTAWRRENANPRWCVRSWVEQRSSAPLSNCAISGSDQDNSE